MDRARLIERLTQRPPGRRGFGGSDDPLEAAAFREVIRGDHDLNPGMTRPSTALRPAAVLVPLVEHPHGMSVLLTQRTAHLSAHAGQISFPGGRIEEHDPDAVAAALRETEEEVGLPRDRVSVIGRLDTYVTGTGFEITPIVGLVAPPLPAGDRPVRGRRGVRGAARLSSSTSATTSGSSAMSARGAAAFSCCPIEGRNIWGATAGILVNLAEVLAECGAMLRVF